MSEEIKCKNCEYSYIDEKSLSCIKHHIAVALEDNTKVDRLTCFSNEECDEEDRIRRENMLERECTNPNG